MHRVLQRFHSPDKDYLEKDLLQLLDEEWDSSGFFYKEQENEFKIQGEEILSRYFLQNTDHNDSIIAREEKFSFMIDNIIINGVIDRIDNTIEGHHVIDYKTNNTPSSAKSSMQLAIYSMFLNSSGELQDVAFTFTIISFFGFLKMVLFILSSIISEAAFISEQ